MENVTVVNKTILQTTFVTQTDDFKALHLVILVLLMVATLLGNVSLIVVIACTKHLHTVTNMFIISLAFSDLLVSVIVIPINLAIPTALFYGYTTCMYAASFTIIVALSSISNIFAVTIDRYIAISLPLHYKIKMTKPVAATIVTLVWICCIVLGMLPVLGWRVKTSVCLRGETYPPYYVILIFILGVIVPIWGSAFLYTKIFNLAKCHQQRIRRNNQQAYPMTFRHNPNVNQQENTSLEHTTFSNAWNTNKKTIKTLVILMLYYQLSWLPVFISMITDAFISPKLIPSWLHSLLGTLAFVNSALDPIIYGYRNREIKAAYISCVKRCLCIRQVVFTPNTSQNISVI